MHCIRYGNQSPHVLFKPAYTGTFFAHCSSANTQRHKTFTTQQPGLILTVVVEISSLVANMEHRSTDRASDEVPFLTDEEKDVFTLKRPSRRQKWAHLLPYSGVLNVTLLIALLATWILHSGSRKAYIPNEIYCTSPCAPVKQAASNTEKSTRTICG